MRDVEATITEEADGSLVVQAPLVGIWSNLPSDGSIITSRGAIGQIQVGSKRFRILIPFGKQGKVSSIAGAGDHQVAVEWGQELLRLEPLRVGAESSATDASETAEQRALQYRSPTAGIFYGRPSPDAAPFVEVGATIEQGSPIGLVEVMKTFNQILLEDSSLPSRVTVIRCLVVDGAEVQAGEPLFDLAPA
jgi:hypothetical protein